MGQFTWPREVVPEAVSGLQDNVPGKMIAPTGSPQVRTQNAAGVEWTEFYPPLKPRRAADAELYAKIRWAGSRNILVDIDFPTIPGSGKPPRGVGGSAAVQGAGQAGDSLVIDGFPASTTGVVRAGDVFRVAGIKRALWCREDADSDGTGTATVQFMVPILAGNEPADNATVTLENVTVEAYVWSWTGKPRSTRVDSFGGIEVTFVEDV